MRTLVARYGWNSTSYQIINPRMDHWFSEDRDAVIAYFASVGVCVVAGAPVCAESRLPRVSQAFEHDMANRGNSVCYFCAESRVETLFHARAVSARVLLGAQPVWDPRGWAGIVSQHASLRAQLHRARNKGVVVSEWSTSEAHEHPELHACLDRWLDTKGLPTLRFLVDPDTLGRLFDRRIFVAQRGHEIVGFLVLAPIAERNGWLFEQFPHAPSAPNGTVELMVDAAMRAMAEGEYKYATLGLSPLSTRAPSPRSATRSGCDSRWPGSVPTGSASTTSTAWTASRPSSAPRLGACIRDLEPTSLRPRYPIRHRRRVQRRLTHTADFAGVMACGRFRSSLVCSQRACLHFESKAEPVAIKKRSSPRTGEPSSGSPNALGKSGNRCGSNAIPGGLTIALVPETLPAIIAHDGIGWSL